MAARSTTRLRMNTARKAVQTYRKVYADANKLGRALQTKRPSRFLHSENPPALETEATPYTSEFPFELIRYDYLIPPTYDIENERYAADIADSMEQSGWTGRPLWGMFDEERDWADDHGTGDLVPEIELRTGSHRWFALGLLRERGIWPANLPDGYVPVVIMRRSEVPSHVWNRWAEADWYGMKELVDEGIGPMPIVQLMRAERNPKTRKRGKLHRIGDLAKKTALDAITGPLRIVSKADTILTNPGTPTVKYELVDTTAKKNKLIGTFRFMQDVNGAKQLYWKSHPMAQLELRTIRENPTGHEADFYRQGFEVGRRNRGKSEHEIRATGLSEPYEVHQQGAFMADRLIEVYSAPARLRQDLINAFSRGYYDGFHGRNKAKKMLAANPPALTDRAYRYRANRNAPEGPKICVFCEATEDVQVGHLDGHEENDSPDNLVWNCRSCNAILSHQFKELGLGRRTRQFNPREYHGEGAINLAQWVQAVGQVGRHRGDFISATDMTAAQAKQLIRDTPFRKRSEFNREIRDAYLARKGEVPF